MTNGSLIYCQILYFLVLSFQVFAPTMRQLISFQSLIWFCFFNCQSKRLQTLLSFSFIPHLLWPMLQSFHWSFQWPPKRFALLKSIDHFAGFISISFALDTGIISSFPNLFLQFPAFSLPLSRTRPRFCLCPYTHSFSYSSLYEWQLSDWHL